MSKSPDLEKAHNDGQTDASNGEHSPPHGRVSTFVGVFLGTDEKYRAENEAYEEGHAHSESQKSGGCFLTTACVNHAGLTDDCYELATLRSFRDSYVAQLDNGRAVLAEYYDVAPALVRQIEQSADRDAVLSGIFTTVTKAVKLIEQKSFQEAFACYEAMFADLKQRYHCVE